VQALLEPSTNGFDTTTLLTALTALKKGNFSVRLPVEWTGVAGKVADTLNEVIELNERLAKELEHLRQVVGKEGKITQRASLGDVSGRWMDSITSVNALIDDLVHPTSETARVIGAVAQGDLSQTMALEVDDRPLHGEFLRTAKIVNKMVDQLGSFASEVTRVAREVGTEGKLGGQAKVKGVAGTWKDLTDSVNSMAGNLTDQVRNIADVTTAVANGNLSKKITVDVKGEFLELKNTINTMVDQLSSFASEVTRVAREVGTEGKLGGQARVEGVSGTWKDLTDSVNFMAGNLTSQVRNIADVTKAVANGDLSRKITVDVKGEILELKDTINTMVDQLNSFASEVTRVAREVGTEGKLGGQADVKGVAGTWKDLTDSVNSMAGNLTAQVRGIAKVVTAVANGDLKRKLTVEAKGEIAALADTINSMIDTLATFADQVTSVAREVGVEGQLGGQAKVPGAAGTWKMLTENVNQLAANLTTQVRAIAEVATAVTKGDLTRSITVEAQGEVAALKDTINEMIRNLKDTTQKNTEQDWLKTNLAKFSRMLQGQRDLATVGRLILSELAPVVSAQQAVFYFLDSTKDSPQLTLLASYADKRQLEVGKQLSLGEGLVGQCALEKQRILITNAPPDYIRISSALGEAAPRGIIVLPVVFESRVKGVIELASFEHFNPTHLAFLDQLTESIGIVLNTIEANMRTEDLLKQSQSLAQELQSRQEELQNTNQELQEKAGLLAHQNQEVERKNREVEQARQALEEKAKQLALTSKYKSEFLANMSHELRTPLNSLLILSDQLSKNPDGNLTPRQTEFAKTIHSSGNDLLMLINDILDLSKIESGTVVVDVGELRLADLDSYVERTFRHVAESKGLEFYIHLAPDLPKAIFTDAKRLQQVIKNLLSNAFKFTQRGQVSLTVALAKDGWSPENESLNRASSVLAFSVADTGIGIVPDKQQIIFEAFQQADGSTSRKYGGTGLGLAISRELSRLLGGEIRLVSTPGKGSTFTLYLPPTYAPQKGLRKPGETESGVLKALPRLDGTGNGSAAVSKPVRNEYSTPAVALRSEDGPTAPEAHRLINEAGDDRDNLQPGEPLLLIVENDLPFAKLLLETAHDKGFKGLVTSLGAAALAMTREYKPDALTLDICLPDIDGWRVLERLKNDIVTRHIPVCVVSTEEARARALHLGALSFVAKPIQTRETLERLLDGLKEFLGRSVKSLLVVETDPAQRERVLELMDREDIQCTTVASGRDALQMLRERRIDCMVLDPRLPDMTAAALAEEMQRDQAPDHLSVIVYASPDLSEEDTAGLKKLSDTFALRQVHSPERLLDQTAFFLHSPVAKLPVAKREMLEKLYQTDKVLSGKKVLIVDDDIRNIFALSSVLEWHNMVILSAETGRDAIALLQAQPDIDVVLMDIMMPEMDGYETMRAIRQIPRFQALPIIAVTAKAMKGDREKCIEAGAWDYLAKPVDAEQMLAVLRSWLHR
jgi:signal transduction histidine kinase/CheY-like chemotaxis protein/HAMP domain-containing protein